MRDEKQDPWSDEKLIEFLHASDHSGLDGVWSQQSKSIAKALGAALFDMNSWWTKTPPSWVCDGCGRTKPQIARLNSRGEITCQLVEHHDHMDRYIEKRLAAHIKELPEFQATVESDRFAERSAAAVAAFDPIVICTDCNNADASAKRTVKAHSDFSFTAKDLRAFVIARPNQPHKVDRDKLNGIWSFRREQLQNRFALADHIVQLAAKNEQWYEIADFSRRPERIDDLARAKLSLMNVPGLEIDKFISISAPKPNRDRDRRKWRIARRQAKSTPPTDKELEWLKIKRVELWRAVPDEWCCDWCRRPKIETVRPAKASSGWAFKTHPAWKTDPSTFRPVKQVICQDCQDTRQCLAVEASVPAAEVLAEEVIAVLRPRPHAPHDLIGDAEIDAIVARTRARKMSHVQSYDDGEWVEEL